MVIAEAVVTRHGGVQMPRQLFDYEVIDFIGEGAGSLIYLVAHPQSRQVYALKHLVYRKERDSRFFEQLENEFQVSRRFAHPVLRKSIELKDNRTLFRKATEAVLVMELFDGSPLEACRRGGVATTLGCFIQ